MPNDSPSAWSATWRRRRVFYKGLPPRVEFKSGLHQVHDQRHQVRRRTVCNSSQDVDQRYSELVMKSAFDGRATRADAARQCANADPDRDMRRTASFARESGRTHVQVRPR